MDSLPDDSHLVIAELVVARRKELLRLARSIGLNTEDGEDATQDCMIRALEKAHQFDRTRSIWPWLRKLCENVMLTMRSKVSRNNQRNIVDEERISNETDETISFDSCDFLLLQKLEDVVLAMPPDDQELVKFGLADGRSVREVATLTGMKKSTVAKRLKLIREQLRQAVEN